MSEQLVLFEGLSIPDIHNLEDEIAKLETIYEQDEDSIGAEE